MDIMITTSQFSFILCYIIYITQSTHDLFLHLAGIKLSLFTITLCLSLLIVPVTLYRNLKNIECCFSFGTFCNLAAGIIIIAVLTKRYEDNEHHWGEEVEALNPNTYLSFVGFAIYTWEGIGLIMPIMDASENP